MNLVKVANDYMLATIHSNGIINYIHLVAFRVFYDRKHSIIFHNNNEIRHKYDEKSC